MKFKRVVCVLLFTLNFTSCLAGQQALPVGQKDPQAVAVINQALGVTGGVIKLASIMDYTAYGNITYHLADDIQGTVTMKAGDLNHFRMDSTLPNGMLSQVTSDGLISVRTPDGTIKQFPAEREMGPSSPLIPYMRLPAVLNDSRLAVVYVGLITLNGRSAHEIRFQFASQDRNSAGKIIGLPNIEIFVDALNFQIIMTQETLPNGPVHRYWYANYKIIGSLLTPCSIAEDIDGHEIWIASLDDVQFNVGWQESDFRL